MKKILKFFSVIVFMCLFNTNMRIYAEEINGNSVVKQISEFIQENYQEILSGLEVTENIENTVIGSIYYIFDENASAAGKYFYIPVVQNDQVILVIEAEYDNGSISKITISGHNKEVLNRLDYLNQDCCIYRVGAEIYAENAEQSELLYTEQTDVGGKINGDENQIFFQNLEFSIKITHYKNLLSQTIYKIGSEADSEERESELHKSRQYDTVQVEDAEEYLESVYRKLLKKETEYYLGYLNMDFSEGEIDEVRLGTPFVEYNVDGEQYAVLYFPLYKGANAVGIMTVWYSQKCWQIAPENTPFSYRWDMLDELDYENNEVVFYSINNTYYAESRDKCVRVGRVRANEETLYSDEEVEFIRMTWEQKKKKAEEKLNNLKPVSNNILAADDDISRQTVGADREAVIPERYRMLLTAGGWSVVLAGGCIGIIIAKRISRK